MNTYTVALNGIEVLSNVAYEEVSDWIAEGHAGTYALIVHPDPDGATDEKGEE
jgi:hypothetical protein